MGTSKSFGGPSGTNPLLPSWLQPPPDLQPSELAPLIPVELPGEVSPELPLPAEPQPAETPAPSEAQPRPETPLEVPLDAPTRFIGARRIITTTARGAGSNTPKLRKATSDYVHKGLGGANRAGSRMAKSAKTAGNVIGFIRAIQERGFIEAARDFGLGDVTGKTPQEIGPLLTEVFLEQGGDIDTGISNRAWVDTVIEAIENDLVDINAITGEMMLVMLENFVTRTIELRLQQDIGTQLLRVSPNAERAQQVKNEIHQLVQGEVRRAVRPVLQATARVHRSRLASVGLRIYRQSFEYLQNLPEEE